MTAVSTSGTAPHPRLRVRARLVLAGLSACGLAALAWASFVHPLPRLIYNPSDSVAVGWYRVDPLDHRASSLPRLLSVGSIVLVPLPTEAAALAAQRGYLPARVRCSSVWAPSRRRRCASLAALSASTACLRPPCCPLTAGAGRCRPGSNAVASNPVNCSCSV